VIFSIRSERLLVEQIDYNLLFFEAGQNLVATSNQLLHIGC